MGFCLLPPSHNSLGPFFSGSGPARRQRGGTAGERPRPLPADPGASRMRFRFPVASLMEDAISGRNVSLEVLAGIVCTPSPPG